MSLADDRRNSVRLSDDALSELQALLGDRMTTSLGIRRQHADTGLTYHASAPPEGVAFPHSTEEVSAVVKICARHGVPVIAFGAGSSVEGHFQAIHGGITLDLSQMNEVIEVNAEDLDCTVQPGVNRKQLNEYLRDTGLFFPIDPGADASLGGMASTRASGTNAVRYGTMRENVLALTVVLADGRIIRTARRARKSSAGYDLTRLFVGSEGTLGIITEVTLRLYGIPEAISAAVCPFESLEGAVNTVIETIQMGISVARMELLDDVTMRCVIEYSKLDQYREEPMLFFEFHGTPAGVEEQAKMVGEIARANGAGDFQWTANAEERNRLWQARHDVNWALGLLKQTPEETMLATDVCVPISRLADCIMETKRDLEETGLRSGIVGHVGDGNFHMGIVTDFNDPVKKKAAVDFSDRLTDRALAMGGTCTGEHGVGIGKMKFLAAEHGEALSVMRMLKQALDPDNIMNPGKIISL